MLADPQNLKSKVSWARFYNIVATILATAQLNYFSEYFVDRMWKKVLMCAALGYQFGVVFLCLMGLLRPNDYDVGDMISCLIIIFTAISIIWKAATLIYFSAVLKELSDVVLSATSRNDLKPWELKLARKYYRYSSLICFKVLLLYMLTMVTYISMPIYFKKLPILMEFPGTNRTDLRGYVINYILGSYCVMYGTTIEIGFDIPTFLQACFISYQLDRCVHYCNMIGDFTTTYDTREKQSKLLFKCVKLHAGIFAFIKQASRVNTSVVALTVMNTLPLLTVASYSVLLVGIKSAAPFLIAACIYNLFMYCFLGEVVSTKCQEASTAIYNSQWYEIENSDERRTLLFLLTVSQCDMRFSAGGVYKLSLETFTEVIKHVYGAYAFLQEVL